MTNSNEEALPGEDGVGGFKKAWLEGLLSEGYAIDFAYGNASTDVYAYLESGLPPESVCIIGPNAGDRGTQSAEGTWEPRIEEVELLPVVEQPFEW